MKSAAGGGTAKPAKTFKGTFFNNLLFGRQALTDHTTAIYSTVLCLICTWTLLIWTACPTEANSSCNGLCPDLEAGRRGLPFNYISPCILWVADMSFFSRAVSPVPWLVWQAQPPQWWQCPGQCCRPGHGQHDLTQQMCLTAGHGPG